MHVSRRALWLVPFHDVMAWGSEVVDSAARSLIKAIELVGMARLGTLWDLKLMVEALPLPLADRICDLALWYSSSMLPAPLSPELMEVGKRYNHHVLVELVDFGDGELESARARLEAFDKEDGDAVVVRALGAEEAAAACRFR